VKLFGWALILVGGGLVVVGARKLLTQVEPDEPDDGSTYYSDGPELPDPDLNDGV
jgi:hypothetical protein